MKLMGSGVRVDVGRGAAASGGLHTVAGVIRGHPTFRDTGFNHAGVAGWVDLGAAVPLVAGWRTDRARAAEQFAECLLLVAGCRPLGR